MQSCPIAATARVAHLKAEGMAIADDYSFLWPPVAAVDAADALEVGVVEILAKLDQRNLLKLQLACGTSYVASSRCRLSGAISMLAGQGCAREWRPADRNECFPAEGQSPNRGPRQSPPFEH